MLSQRLNARIIFFIFQSNEEHTSCRHLTLRCATVCTTETILNVVRFSFRTQFQTVSRQPCTNIRNRTLKLRMYVCMNGPTTARGIVIAKYSKWFSAFPSAAIFPSKYFLCAPLVCQALEIVRASTGIRVCERFEGICDEMITTIIIIMFASGLAP